MAWHEGIYSFIAYLLYFELKRIPHQYQYHYKSSSVQFTFTSKKVRKTKQEILGKQRTFFLLNWFGVAMLLMMMSSVVLYLRMYLFYD